MPVEKISKPSILYPGRVFIKKKLEQAGFDLAKTLPTTPPPLSKYTPPPPHHQHSQILAAKVSREGGWRSGGGERKRVDFPTVS